MKFKSITTVLTILFCVSTFSLIGCDGNGGDSNPVSPNGTNDQPANTLSSTPTISNFVINSIPTVPIFREPPQFSINLDYTDAEGDIASYTLTIEGSWGRVRITATSPRFGGETSGTISDTGKLELPFTPSGLQTATILITDSAGNSSNVLTSTFRF